MRFIFRSDRWRSKGIICRKAEITLRQQGKQERSARPRKRDGLPRAPLLGELASGSETERFNPKYKAYNTRPADTTNPSRA